MFDEMAAYVAHDNTVSPAEVLAMATVHGARAIGLAPGAGTLSEGAPADLCAIPDSVPSSDVLEGVVVHHGKVLGTWIDGARAWDAVRAGDAGDAGDAGGREPGGGRMA